VIHVYERLEEILLIKFILGAYSALRSLNHVNLGSVVDVSEIHTAFIFRAEWSRVGECEHIGHWSKRITGKDAAWCPFRANRGSGSGREMSNCPSILKTEAVFTSQSSAMSLISTACKDSREESKSAVNCRESVNSEITSNCQYLT
jgi:hypothetical protein